MNPSKPLVSIIVPVYNVSAYIEECVKSCINQNYVDIEIVLVDDGSTDDSGVICDKYAKNYENIKVLHKMNGGLSDARNYGIEHSSGQYLMFVDSDDIISENIVSLLFKCLTDNRADVSVCDLAHFKDGSKPSFSDVKKSICFSGKQALCDFLYQRRISTSSCAKLYKRDSIGNIRFVKGQRFEDNEFLYRVFNSVSAVVYVDAALYAYRHREKSITNYEFSKKDFDVINIGRKILNECKNTDIKKAATAYQCSNSLRVYLTASEKYFCDSEFLYCKLFLDKNSSKVLFNTNISTKLRLATCLYLLRIPRNLMIWMRAKKGRWS